MVFCHNTAQYLFLHYRELIQAAIGAGCTVVCVCPADKYVNRLKSLGAFHVDWYLSQHGMNPAAELVSIMRLRRILRSQGAEKVLSFSIKPNLYIALLNLFSVRYRQFCMITGLGYAFIGGSSWRNLVRALLTRAYRVLFRGIDCAIFQNPLDRDFFVANSMVEEAKTLVIPGSGIDTSYFCEKQWSEAPHPVRFLFVGRLLADKGLGELIDAADRLHGGNCVVDILGPRDENPGALDEERLKNALDGDIIRYHGETEDVRPWLRQADVFVLPSYREGLSRSILEAMSTGLPVITTDVPGCRDLVTEGENGTLVPPRNADALYRAMKSYMDDPEKIRNYGRASRERVEREFQVETVNKLILARLEIALC